MARRKRQSAEEEVAAQVIGCVRIDQTEAEGFWQRWREEFIAPMFKATGDWEYEGYVWHAFSMKFVPALERDAAVSAYRHAMDARVGGSKDERFIVFAGGGNLEAFWCVSHSAPMFNGRDLYVAPRDLSWTMVFTHEDGWYGPYFVSARNQA